MQTQNHESQNASFFFKIEAAYLSLLEAIQFFLTELHEFFKKFCFSPKSRSYQRDENEEITSSEPISHEKTPKMKPIDPLGFFTNPLNKLIEPLDSVNPIKYLWG